MKIVLFGYGKMGKEIEVIALERKHEISLIIDAHSKPVSNDQLKEADVAIEFSQPESAVENIKKCFDANLPIVVGTTGWYEAYEEVCSLCKEKNASLLAATNFSIGVNLFFEINSFVAQLMSKYTQYETSLEESHHTQKLDAPSGTAITLAEGILQENTKYKKWVKGKAERNSELGIISHRIENVPGTHLVQYHSSIDDIEITHTAHNRKGFALGAVIAAEFLKDKTGVFSMKDVLNK